MYKRQGNGIVPEDIERIFERFYQSKKSIKYPVYGQSSTGIGLFLCKKIISLHGGNIYAGNNPKQGAFFRILLPLEKGIPQAESEKEKYEQNEHPLSIPANGNEKKETILIVEDNADMRTYICSILKNNHTKESFGFVYTMSLSESPDGLKDFVMQVLRERRQLKLGNMPIYLSEWNNTPSQQDG